MKRYHILYEKGDCKWTVLYHGSTDTSGLLDSNEYMITYAGKHLLLDPGGLAVFPSILSSLVQLIDPKDIEAIFASHQDPDIVSSISLWNEVTDDLKCYAPQIWGSFLTHFSMKNGSLVPIPDQGLKFDLNGLSLEAIPAHYMHSSGNFHLYDREAKILFSGDTGAALFPKDRHYLFVKDFDDHVQYIEGFHRRWFGSNEHKNAWCERVGSMDVELICPQHGAIYHGDNAKRFIDWLYKLNVGIANNRGTKL